MDAPARFTKMAADIERNTESPFGGACVIVPPENGGESIELLILSATGDPADFWTLLKTRCDQEIRRAEDVARKGQAGWGR